MSRTQEAKPFRVHIGGRRYRRFSTLEEASIFCEAVRQRTKIILSIVQAA